MPEIVKESLIMQEENVVLWKKEKLFVLDWNGLGECLEKIRFQILESSFTPTTIVSISRGGLILGASLANLFNIRDFYVMSITRNLSNEKYSTRKQAEFRWIAPEPTNFVDKHVLVADDIAGDGGTLALATAVLRSRGATSLGTAVIVKNQNSKFNPDFLAFTVDDWVVFPWEPPAESGTP
ncbi:MAG: hypothetical protein HC890_11525 [Chloroflexaceae bacterium]|nr:hypothetical protein [Chloroflexaceae bacterium]